MKNPNQNSIMLVKDYGHIRIKLNKILEEKGLNRNQIATAIGSRFEVIDKWNSGSVEKIDADVLARLCFVLNCDVQDIIEHIKP